MYKKYFNGLLLQASKDEVNLLLELLQKYVTEQRVTLSLESREKCA